MLVGNPHEFAIWLDPVKEWTVQSTVEGLFILCVDGVFLVKRSSLSARAVTLSGESEFWMERLRRIDDDKQTETRGRNKEELFEAAVNIIYSEDGAISLSEGIELTPQETKDSYWHVYLFRNSATNEDVVVYSHDEDETIRAMAWLALPSRRSRHRRYEFG